MAKKKQVYEEYFVNESHIQKLYHMYIHQSVFDRVLDLLVLFAVIFTAVGLALEFFVDISDSVLHIIHSSSLLILVIFIFELLREYARSKSRREFFKKNWIDVFLVVSLSLVFFFAAYFGLSRLRFLNSFGSYTQEAKHYRILFNFFKK